MKVKTPLDKLERKIILVLDDWDWEHSYAVYPTKSTDIARVLMVLVGNFLEELRSGNWK